MLFLRNTNRETCLQRFFANEVYRPGIQTSPCNTAEERIRKASERPNDEAVAGAKQHQAPSVPQAPHAPPPPPAVDATQSAKPMDPQDDLIQQLKAQLEQAIQQKAPSPLSRSIYKHYGIRHSIFQPQALILFL